uniref:Uncharacterized protein n=1 Tax=Anguilla anguilla TaxID=7936 RepID=A0A0E9TL85_ANGAN
MSSVTYSAVSKYLDSDTVFVVLALYSTILDF